MLGKSFFKNENFLFKFKKLLSGKDSPDYYFAEIGMQNAFKAIQTSEWKYIYGYNNENEELYNIKSDPKELENLADKEPLIRNKFKERLFNWVSNAKKHPTINQALMLSKKEVEMLEALGYVTTPKNPGNDGNSTIDGDGKVVHNSKDNIN